MTSKRTPTKPRERTLIDDLAAIEEYARFLRLVLDRGHGGAELEQDARDFVGARGPTYSTALGPPGDRERHFYTYTLIKAAMDFYAGEPPRLVAEVSTFAPILIREVVILEILPMPSDLASAQKRFADLVGSTRSPAAEDLARWALISCGMDADMAGKRIDHAMPLIAKEKSRQSP